MVHTRESELAMKNDLLSRQEEEISEMRKHLEELLHQVDQKEHERRSDFSRKRQLEQAEKDLVCVCVCVCVCARVHVRMYVHACVCLCVPVYLYAYVQFGHNKYVCTCNLRYGFSDFLIFLSFKTT